MTGVEWEQPPDTRRGAGSRRTPNDDLADALRSNPGAWAVYRSAATSVAPVTQIRSGHLKSFRPAGAFEATSRKQDDGSYKIWIRYVAEEAGA